MSGVFGQIGEHVQNRVAEAFKEEIGRVWAQTVLDEPTKKEHATHTTAYLVIFLNFHINILLHLFYFVIIMFIQHIIHDHTFLSFCWTYMYACMYVLFFSVSFLLK